MIAEFKFLLHTDLIYGLRSSLKLGDFLSEKSCKRIMVIVDEGVHGKSIYFKEFMSSLHKNISEVYVELIRGSEEPDYDYLDEVAERVKLVDKLDMIIGIGGGSCLDITKAVAVLKTNSGKGIEYRGFDRVTHPGIPTIAIPTTAGTGSEVTINAVFTDKKEMKKLGINGRFMNATYAVLDAEWTTSCPYNIALSSGMDAMTHALESFICNKANIISRTFSKEAFRRIYNSLPAILDDPENREKRQDLLTGSYLAAIALFNSGSGIAGAFSYPIGVHFKVPHGLCCAVFLSSVIEFNVNKGYTEYSDLFDIVELNTAYTASQKSEKFVWAIKGLSAKLGVPQYLEQWGITKENVDEVVKLLLPLQGAFDQNPVPFSAERDAHEMLKRHVMK